MKENANLHLQNIYSLCLGTRFPGREREWRPIFFFREKVSLSAVVGKKDGCLTDRSSCLPERSEGRQRREVRQSFRPETKERETFSRKRKRSDRTISLPGKRFLSRGMHFLSWEGFSERLVGQNYKMAKKLIIQSHEIHLRPKMSILNQIAGTVPPGHPMWSCAMESMCIDGCRCKCGPLNKLKSHY